MARLALLISDENLVNLAAGDGNPIEIMGLGLASQALSFLDFAGNAESLAKDVRSVPHDVEHVVAQRAVDYWIN